jgi:cytochrome b involved in lipid metabolism
MGEGYHNFHHQFPMDYRNAFRWYQYDPTKWFIATCYFLGLASHLRVFPSNEVEKGALSMKLKELKTVQDSLVWPCWSRDLPVVTWETCKASLLKRAFTAHLLSFQSRKNPNQGLSSLFLASYTMCPISLNNIRVAAPSC